MNTEYLFQQIVRIKKKLRLIIIKDIHLIIQSKHCKVSHYNENGITIFQIIYY